MTDREKRIRELELELELAEAMEAEQGGGGTNTSAAPSKPESKLYGIKKALLPMQTESSEMGEGFIKQNLKAGVDVLSAPSRAFDFATKAVGKGMDAISKATTGKELGTSGGAPGFRAAVSEATPEAARPWTDPVVGLATDPFTFVGPAAFGKATSSAAMNAERKMIEEMATNSKAISKGGKAARFAKQQVAQFAKKDADVLEEAARGGLPRLKKAGVDAGNGGVESLVGDVQQMLTEINAGTMEQAKSKVAQISKSLDDKISQSVNSAKTKVEGLIQKSGVGPSERGMKISESLESAKGKAGERFGEIQSQIPMKDPLAQADSKNIIIKGIDGVLEKAGFKGDKFRGVESFGSVPATPQDFADANFFRGLAGEAQTTEDALNQLRLIRKLKGSRKPDGSFYNSKMLGEIDGAYQEAIEQQLNQSGGEKLVALWRENNARYKSVINTVGDLKKKLSVDKAPSEAYASKIKSIGVNDLIEMKTLAATDEGIANVWNELSDGFFDDMVHKSLAPDGSLDIQKFKKAWQKIDESDPKTKALLLGPDKVSKIDKAISNFESAVSGGDALREQTGQTIKSIEKTAAASQIGKPLTGPGAYSKIRNVRSDTGQAKETTKVLQFLDDYYGTDFVTEAQDFAKARHLGITADGTVPWVTDITTGRSVLGPVAGSVLGDVPVIGKALGAILGIAGQSPAGAIALFRKIDSVSRFGNVAKKNLGRMAIPVSASIERNSNPGKSLSALNRLMSKRKEEEDK